MRLLVTRPEPFGAETAAALTRRGHHVLLQPLLAVTFLPPPDDLPEPAGVIVTSRNGVRALVGWPAAARWREKPLFASGPGTARALTGLGFGDVHAGSSDAASLGTAVRATIAADEGPLIYVAARDRTVDLGDTLAVDGYRVVTVEAYRADAVARLSRDVVAALRAGRIDGVLVYSGRTARVLVEAARADGVLETLAPLTAFALSAAVAAVLRPVFHTVVVASSPNEDAMLAALPPGA